MMAPSQLNNLIDSIDEVSLDTDRASIAINNKKSAGPHLSLNAHNNLKPTNPSPTLLTLPLELRTSTFSHLYAPPAPSSPIALHIVSTTLAGISSTEAPPTKSSLLICRQLYAELREMHKAAFRHYWTTSTFLINPSGARRENLFLTTFTDTPSISRITRFDFEGFHKRLGFFVVKLRFDPGSGAASESGSDSEPKWTATTAGTSFERTMQLAAGGGVAQSSAVSPQQQRQLKNLVRSVEGSMRMARRTHGGGGREAAIDPRVGRGLRIRDLDQLSLVVRHFT